MRTGTDGVATGLAVLSTVLVVAPLVAIFIYLIYKGASSLSLAFFTQIPKPEGESGGGMANAIVGSAVLLGIASLIGVPVGISGDASLGGRFSGGGASIAPTSPTPIANFPGLNLIPGCTAPGLTVCQLGGTTNPGLIRQYGSALANAKPGAVSTGCILTLSPALTAAESRHSSH